MRPRTIASNPDISITVMRAISRYMAAPSLMRPRASSTLVPRLQLYSDPDGSRHPPCRRKAGKHRRTPDAEHNLPQNAVRRGLLMLTHRPAPFALSGDLADKVDQQAYGGKHHRGIADLAP